MRGHSTVATLAWDNTKRTRLLATTQVANWTWDEFHAVAEHVNVWVRTQPHTVDVIVDMSSLRSVPSGAALTHFRQVRQRQAPNHGLRVVVNAPALLRTLLTMYETTDHAMGARVYIAATLDEARRICRANQPSLPPASNGS